MDIECFSHNVMVTSNEFYEKSRGMNCENTPIHPLLKQILTKQKKRKKELCSFLLVMDVCGRLRRGLLLNNFAERDLLQIGHGYERSRTRNLKTIHSPSFKNHPLNSTFYLNLYNLFLKLTQLI